MAIITIKTGGRGRPLKIDTEKALQSFLKSKELAQARLYQLRKEAHGVRAESIIGSDLSLPSALEASYDVLQALRAGEQISYQTAKELRAGLLAIKQLASKQERVYGRALAETFKRQYLKDIEQATKYASKFTKEQFAEIKTALEKLTPAQQQKFFLSKGYQDPRTTTGNYQRVIAWAENDILERTGEIVQLTGAEALAYANKEKSLAEIMAILAGF